MVLPANNNVVGYLQAGSYTAQQDRLIGAVRSQRTGGSLGHGVHYNDYNGSGSKNFETTAVGGMGISVAPGFAQVIGYAVYCPAATALTIAAATATARRDLIVLHVYDVEKGDADNGAVVEIVKGTTTTDPSMPVGSLLLAHVDLPANAVSISQGNIVGRRQYTAAAGGTIILPDAVPTDAQAQQMALGSLGYNVATGKTLQQRGSGAAGLAEFVQGPFAGTVKTFYTYGGFTTNASGDIAIACSPVTTAQGLIATAEATGPYFITKVAGASSGFLLLRVWYAGGAGGAVPLGSNFINLSVFVWGP